MGIAHGVVAFVGEEFFRSLVKNLATGLGARYAFVAEFIGPDSTVRTLAYWGGDDYFDNVEFDVVGTPCEEVIKGNFTHHSHGVQQLFPKHTSMVRLGVESYLGVPLLDSQGKTLGHLAVLDTKPFGIDPDVVTDLELFSARASVELERQRGENRLRASEERLATILGSAMDAIITVDGGRRITLFNTAAERMFLREPDQVIGQSLDPFLSESFCAFFDGYVKQHARADAPKSPLWAPGGLTARRANGEEFPVEVTISPMEASGERYVTLILRDVNERKSAKAALDRLQLEKVYLQEEIRSEHNEADLVGTSAALAKVCANIESVAPTDSTVLIAGETGTGKELVARAVHNRSRRCDKLLVKINCAALPRELIESELFGHEKGAFTGATQQKKGRFELANGGTLFMDEIGELSLEAQAKLLRVLQEQEFERVGGTQSISVNVRVVAATNRDLAKLVNDGGFRSDLFYRLNVFPLDLPPLRDRREDIPALVEFFLAKLRRSMGKTLTRVSEESMARLVKYHWPGNIRELQNVIERAAILSQGDAIEIDDSLQLKLGNVDSGSASGTLVEMERSHILRVLESTEWVIGGARGAAAILDIHANTLRSRMQKLGIERPKPGANA